MVKHRAFDWPPDVDLDEASRQAPLRFAGRKNLAHHLRRPD